MKGLSTSTAGPPERPLPAWALSFLVHLGLLLLLVMTLRTTPHGGAEEPGRNAGIVLKHSSPDGDYYTDEESSEESNEAAVENASQQAAETLSTEAILSALPAEADPLDLENALPQLPLLGSGAMEPGGGHDAARFITGGAPPAKTDGGEARVEIFGVAGVGNRFVYVFDRSSSMEGAPLAAAKRQLLQSLQSLESVHQFQIIFFNHQRKIFDITGGGRRIAFATDRNKQLAANFVGGVTADGGTDRYAALLHAVGLRPDVIFFLTDTDDPMLAGELAKILSRNRRVQASINTIDFGRGPTFRRNNFLLRLAQQSGGQYGYVDTLRLRP